MAILIALSASMQGIRDAIARMDHRQIEAGTLHHTISPFSRSKLSIDISRKPIPQVSGTSASAWRPLYKSAMENTILPSVERWKTSLDTLLIFVRLQISLSCSRLIDRHLDRVILGHRDFFLHPDVGQSVSGLCFPDQSTPR